MKSLDTALFVLVLAAWLGFALGRGRRADGGFAASASVSAALAVVIGAAVFPGGQAGLIAAGCAAAYLASALIAKWRSAS